ncbi:MAG: hypothetical protein ACYC8T_11925 [Myxococcaceae bacterium]
MIRALLVLSLLGHAKGFHKHDVVTVSAREVLVLVTLDVDSGKRCRLLRATGDADGDGKLSGEELMQLKAKLVRLVLRPLEAEVSGYPLTLLEGESKIDLRGDKRTSDTGLSVAVLVRAELPGEVTPGMTLSLADESPDQSHIAVEVHQATAADAGSEKPVKQVMKPGEKVKVRLGQLSNVVRM